MMTVILTKLNCQSLPKLLSMRRRGKDANSIDILARPGQLFLWCLCATPILTIYHRHTHPLHPLHHFLRRHHRSHFRQSRIPRSTQRYTHLDIQGRQSRFVRYYPSDFGGLLGGDMVRRQNQENCEDKHLQRRSLVTGTSKICLFI